ncbi:MAG: hypothetical protein HYW51_01710 [Candidatus Doudnabacteria bacterium]|nr:hypothetical protein [Candidatus Doudnabacteria bacterium]
MAKFIVLIIVAIAIIGLVIFIVQNPSSENINQPLSENAGITKQGAAPLDKTGKEEEPNPADKPETSVLLPAESDSGLDTLPPTLEPAEEQPAPSSTPNPVIVILLANDLQASPQSITVAKDTKVTLVFRVDTKNVAYHGLDFRSPVVDTGNIPSGESKEVSFQAVASFDFIPYWPDSQTAASYTIPIIVE